MPFNDQHEEECGPNLNLDKEKVEALLEENLSEEQWNWLSDAIVTGKDMIVFNLFERIRQYVVRYNETGVDPLEIIASE